GAQAGYVYFDEDPTVPGEGDPNQGWVGLGMMDSATFMLPTQQDTRGGFKVNHEYWIAFSRNGVGSEIGQGFITAPKCLTFTADRCPAVATYTDGEWTIQYSQ